MSSSATMLSCRLILFRRCLRAVLLSVAVQFLLLFVFLLFVNFELLHPLQWLAGTLRLICSWYTWFASIPLVGAVMLYGIALSQQHLMERPYCATRYRAFIQNGPRKLVFLGAHLLVGYLTAWLYAGYLHSDYRQLVSSCFGRDCLSSYHIFLLGIGTVSGCYHFVSEHLQQEVSIDYAIVEQSRTEKLRELLYETLQKTAIKSILPTFGFALSFAVFGSLLKNQLSNLFGLETDDQLAGILNIASNVRLLFYGWLLSTQILCNMQLMRSFYAMLLAEDLPLVLARNRLAINDNAREITVVSALGLNQLYIVQCLAAHFVYKQSKLKNSSVRLEIFQLTEPGNRPANWREFCDQTLSLIGNFTADLNDARKQFNLLKADDPRQQFNLLRGNEKIDLKGPLLAEKLLLRQYNQQSGIRSAVSPTRNNANQSQNQNQSQQWNVNQIKHVPNWCERVSMQIEAALQRLFHRIPGIIYLFVEPEGAKTIYLLQQSLPLVWLSQALSEICVASLQEDRYGVVQEDLPAILKSLHNLKCELDKLSNAVNILKLNNQQTGYIYLRAAVRRSLYNICNSFYDYLAEILPNSEELIKLQSFVKHG